MVRTQIQGGCFRQYIFALIGQQPLAGKKTGKFMLYRNVYQSFSFSCHAMDFLTLEIRKPIG